MNEVVESINRRPEYIEEREKALLDQIFGKYNEETGQYEGGTIQQENLFNIPEYRMAGLDPLELQALNLANLAQQNRAGQSLPVVRAAEAAQAAQAANNTQTLAAGGIAGMAPPRYLRSATDGMADKIPRRCHSCYTS